VATCGWTILRQGFDAQGTLSPELSISSDCSKWGELLRRYGMGKGRFQQDADHPDKRRHFYCKRSFASQINMNNAAPQNVAR
jgi:hypothetical protein